MTLAELRRKVERLERQAPSTEDYEGRLARALAGLEALGLAEGGRVTSFAPPPKCRDEIASIWEGPR